MTTPEMAFIYKRKKLMEQCYYGLEFFCDGTPNKSVDNHNTTPRPPCPNRLDCEICKEKIFKGLESKQ